MDLPTQTHLTKLRDLLNYRRHELETEVHAAELARREGAGADAHEVEDFKDEAAQMQRTQLDGAQEQRDRDELAQVTSALRRLDSGTYGDCVDCREPIALQRLLVQPAALRCAQCQTDQEHRQLQSR
jgi:RNA polymerase-binding transcription factor DksA